MSFGIRPAISNGTNLALAGSAPERRQPGTAATSGPRPARSRRGAGLALAAVLVGAILGTSLVGLPAGADPTAPAVPPDAGARPPANGALAASATQPGQAQNVPPVLGPLAQQIRTETAAVQTLAEQLKSAEADTDLARDDLAAKRAAKSGTDRELARLRDEADSAAAEAYKASQALGPLGEYAADLHRLSRVAPALGPRPGGEATARDLARAEAAAKDSGVALGAAQNTYTALVGNRDSARRAYDERVAALTDLRTRNAAQLERAEAESDAYEQSIGAGLQLGAGPAGFAPDPRIARVLDHARRQLGKPYIFGDEGPNSYDCSGLVWDSYRQIGVNLPRIAKDQYNATAKISRDDLLPGDLVAFGPPGSWINVGHIGIYIGGGRMIHAPSSGDVVKISIVTWSRFYGASRVLPAVGVSTPPTTPAPTSTTPAPTTAPTSPSTSPSTPPSTSPSTPPSDSPSTPPSSPSTPPSTSPAPSPSPSEEPSSPEPTPSTSPEPSTSPAPTTTPPPDGGTTSSAPSDSHSDPSVPASSAAS